MNKPGIVFIHGAGLGSFIWEDVKPYLSADLLFIDFPNRGDHTKMNAQVSLADYAYAAVKQIDAWSGEPFIVVAHSIGGVVGLKIIKYFGKRVKGFVGVSAAIPKKGGSFVTVFSFPKRLLLPLVLDLAGTKPPDKAIVHDLCNDLSKVQTEKVVKNFTPESKGLYMDKCHAEIPDTETLYIKCTNDNGFPLATQDKMAKVLKAKKVVSIKSGHLPMLGHPKEFAKLLEDFIGNIK